MTPHQLAVARSRTYALLAEVLLDGWTDRAVGLVRAMPWGAVLPALPSDALASRHHAALGRGVSPHASVFVSADGQLGGGEGAWWTDWTARTGLASRPDREADHAGCIASALGWLESARADALRDGVNTRPIEVLSAEALARLGWVPWFVVAVRRQGVDELTAVVELLAELVRDQGAPTLVPGEAEDVLADPSHGLKDVADYLLVPARSGIWLGPDDLRRLALAAGVPCGFGRRAQMVESLLFSAVDLEALPALSVAVTAELSAWDEALGPDVRRSATAETLRRLASAAG